jgi:hypothetical protein
LVANYMKKILLALLLSVPCFATTAVTGHIATLGGTVSGGGNFVRFYLRGCGGNQPRVGGTAIIAPTQGGVYFFDLAANSSGDISGTLYSTRDAAGTGDGEIECGGSHTATWYGMQMFHAGKGGPETPIAAKNTDSFDVSNVTPITTNPVVTAPTGDTTYARIDGGNQPFTGDVTPSGTGVLRLGKTTNRWKGYFSTIDINGGGTLAGTFAGGTFTGTTLTSPTISNATLSGNTLFKRLLPTQGTALVNGDGALGGSWGTSPSLGVTGYDSAFRVVVTSGSGSPGANPTFTLTFKDGLWANAPVCVASRLDLVAPAGGYWAVDSTSQTTVRLTFVGTPSASQSYLANVICIGQ